MPFPGNMGRSSGSFKPVQLAGMEEMDSRSSHFLWRTSNSDDRNHDGSSPRPNLQRSPYHSIHDADDLVNIRTQLCLWPNGPCTYDGGLWEEASMALSWLFLHCLEHRQWIFAEQ